MKHRATPPRPDLEDVARQMRTFHYVLQIDSKQIAPDPG
jgi:hypothetical protein